MANKNALQNYHKNTRDLKLVWEVRDRTQRIVEAFKKYRYLGSDQTLHTEYAGYGFDLYVLNIKNSNIDQFKALAQKVTL